MNFNLIHIIDYFRCCACCGIDLGTWALFEDKEDYWICMSCKKFLDTDVFKLTVSELDSDISFLSLCEWRDNNYDLISNLASNLKGNYNNKGWKWVANSLVRHLILASKLPPKDTVIIPVPCGDEQRKHSNIWAKELGKELNLSVDITLLNYNQRKFRQAILDKKDRMSINIQSKKHNYKNIIIVDDVCTTGSTVRASKNALIKASSKKPRFEAIGFVKRV